MCPGDPENPAYSERDRSHRLSAMMRVAEAPSPAKTHDNGTRNDGSRDSGAM
jgi:hypothetical protein